MNICVSSAQRLQFGNAVEALMVVPSQDPREASTRIFRELVMVSKAWNYREDASLARQFVHALRYANLAKNIPTECPPVYPFRNDLVAKLDGWPEREKWILSAMIYINADFEGPHQDDFRLMKGEYEALVLKRPYLEWLAEDMPIHDEDPNIVILCLFFILWNRESPLFQSYGACCVYNLLHPRHHNLSKFAFSAIAESAPASQLDDLRTAIDLMMKNAEPTLKDACRWAAQQLSLHVTSGGYPYR